jgi:HK97 family phage major capsid protein
MKTITEQIAALENTRAAKSARMNEVVNKGLEEGRTTDASEAEEFDTLEKELANIDADLVRLKKLEQLNLQTAKAVDGTTVAKAGASRSSVLPVSVKNTEKLEPGIKFARYATCIALAKGNIMQAQQIALSRYAEDEDVNVRIKAAVAAGTTLDSTYAAPLVRADNFEGDFVEFLRPQTILGQFGQNGVPSLRRIPFNVRITGQTSGGEGYWVGEGAPKPVTEFDFNAVELRWAKVANIAVLTEELIRFSSPSAERLVRDALAEALIARLDIDFITPSKAAVANVSPASITNGVTPIASSGTTADALRDDLRALWGTYITNNINPSDAVYIMNPRTALAVSLMQNPLGQSEFPGLTMNGGTLMGVPVIVSNYVPYTSPGSLVILVNASDIYLADDGQVAIDASREASLQMDNAPTNSSATPTPTTLVSMWQTNSVALRAERYINWAKRRSQAVAYLSGVNWN